MTALPEFSRLEDASISSIPNIYELFSAALHGAGKIWTGDIGAFEFYKETNPLVTSLLLSMMLSVSTLVLSEITRNYSQVDRLWSILPAVYACHYKYFALLNGVQSERLDMIILVTIIWSVRLTYNYWRKGGYNWASEDYRWEVIKEYAGKPLFFIFNITFISIFQNLLLVMITLPIYLFLLIDRNIPKSNFDQSKMDMIFSRAIMFSILLELVADQQQWNFQEAKAQYKKSGKVSPGYSKTELERGFICTGLWAFSRHPNFLGEQAVWILLYQWSAVATDTLYNWTGIGAIAYILIFQGSTWLTELITTQKYKDYQIYQDHVNKFLPGIKTIMDGGFYFSEIEAVKAD